MIEVVVHKALVVGAGQSAKDKIRALTDFGADVTVVAPVISADVVKQGKTIHIERRVYRPGETKGYEIVVAATDNPAVNKQIAHDAARFGAICSVPDDSSRSGFVFPQIIKRKSYSVAVCTESMDEALAAKIKEKIENSVPEKADEIAALFSRARKELDQEPGSRTRLADFSEEEAGSIAESEGHVISENGTYYAEEHDAGSDPGKQEDTQTQKNDAEPHVYEEGDVVKVGALSDRLSQVRADAVISRLEAEGIRCSKVLLRSHGSAPGQLSGEGAQESTTMLGPEDALISGEADIAVRRAAELPYDLPELLAADLCIKREDARDVLVTRKGTGDNEVEVIETDSQSRKAQIERFLKTGEARVSGEGIQVIINHIKAGEADAAVLAAADLERLMFTEDDELDCSYIDVEKSLPPACQGITVLETRKTGKAREAAALLSDEDTEISLCAERTFITEAGVSDKDETAAYSAINNRMLFMKVMKKAGQSCIYFSGMEEPHSAKELAEKLAGKLKESSR